MRRDATLIPPAEPEPLSVESVREGLLQHVADYLKLPIADRTASGLEACVSIVTKLGKDIDNARALKKRAAAKLSADLPYPAPDDGFDPSKKYQ